jgi:hypothetical protein
LPGGFSHRSLRRTRAQDAEHQAFGFDHFAVRSSGRVSCAHRRHPKNAGPGTARIQRRIGGAFPERISRLIGFVP